MTEFISPDVNGHLHIKYILMGLAMWTLVPLIGKNILNNTQRQVVVYLLVILTLGQEIINDSTLMFQGLWNFSADLPLHMCRFSLILTSWALISKKQEAFELAFFWGIAGGSQAILTPDLTGIWNPLGIFVFFFSHSMVILNVIWMIAVEGMRLRKDSLLNTIILTNGFAFIMSIFNSLIGGNYWFLSIKPLSNSPFLIGEWSFYIVGIQLSGIILMGLIYLPWLPYFRRMTLQTESATT